MDGHNLEISCLYLDHNTKKLYSGSWDNSIKVWNPDTG